ncbi:unnamed protein product [Cylindrotheca closterium]|uniref:DNA (cytosine-5-)-methyltransferase n=1 Tax=Cylindrotheca closterium TaxID=2856 RepID=A0AAD2C9Z9_9STRA|nr:unnamed protein product [Cylindrotheca closterium]
MNLSLLLLASIALLQINNTLAFSSHRSMGKRQKKRTHSEIDPQPDDENDLTYVEFYSGIGGWTMAFEEALGRLENQEEPPLKPKRITALDHSDLCMRVFEHNFRTKRKSFQIQIQGLTKKQVETWKSKFWFMSPPCQPHTRQHSNQEKDLSDSRSTSFLHLCTLLSEMEESTLPQMICCENVVGFETSNSFEQWRKALAERNYHVGHFHLTPTQVQLPNDRPRYFSVAVQANSLSSSKDASLYLSYLQHEDLSKEEETIKIQSSIPELGVNVASEEAETADAATISTFLDTADNSDLRIPEKLLNSDAAWCFDIVSPNNRRSSCFTHSYGGYVRGTGSILYNCADSEGKKLIKPEEREFQKDWMKDFDKTKLRYFSGMELARLFGFSERFSFPSSCTPKQQRKLIGNSLNVRIASKIVELGLRCMQLDGKSKRPKS